MSHPYLQLLNEIYRNVCFILSPEEDTLYPQTIATTQTWESVAVFH